MATAGLTFDFGAALIVRVYVPAKVTSEALDVNRPVEEREKRVGEELTDGEKSTD